MKIKGRAWKYGDDVNTDVIFPGKYTYTLQTPEELAAHALEDLDPGFASNVRPGDIVVAGKNWGSGSSREQAVTSLKYAGVGAVIAVSFARIWFRNAINNGLPAIVCPEAVRAIQDGDAITIDLEEGKILTPAGTFDFPPFPPSLQEILKDGGVIEHVRKELRGR